MRPTFNFNYPRSEKLWILLPETSDLGLLFEAYFEKS